MSASPRRDPRRLPIYQAADAAVDAVMAATGLACPTGCGQCCETHRPHVSVGDLAEVAQVMVAEGRGEAVWAAARAATDGVCVFYQAGRLPGGCTIYELRPVLCRLFGFAAVTTKHGASQLAVCHVHKAETPAVAAAAAAWVEAGGPAPRFADHQRAIDALDLDRASPQLPINAALAQALEAELLRASYAAEAAT